MPSKGASEINVISLLSDDESDTTMEEAAPPPASAAPINIDSHLWTFNEYDPNRCNYYQQAFDALLDLSMTPQGPKNTIERHLWHKYPALSERVMFIFSIPELQDNPHLLDLLIGFSDGLSICTECIDAYYAAQDSMKDHYTESSWAIFHDMLRNRDIQRLIQACTYYIQKAFTGAGTGEGSRDTSYTKHLGVPFYEIMSNPHLLRDKALNDLFAKGVDEFNHLTVDIALPPKLPGTFLLLVHPTPQVRHWAYRNARNDMLGSDDLDRLESLLWEYFIKPLEFDQFGENSDVQLKHLVSDSRNLFWSGFYKFMRLLTPEAFKGEAMRRLAASLLDIIINNLCMGTDCFFQVVMVFSLLINNLGEEVWEQSLFHWEMVFSTITTNPALEAMLAQPTTVGMELSHEDGCAAKAVRAVLGWLPGLLCSLPVGSDDTKPMSQAIFNFFNKILSDDRDYPIEVCRGVLLNMFMVVEKAYDKGVGEAIQSSRSVWLPRLIKSASAKDGLMTGKEGPTDSEEVCSYARRVLAGIVAMDIGYLADSLDTVALVQSYSWSQAVWEAMGKQPAATLPMTVHTLLLGSFCRLISEDSYQAVLNRELSDKDAFDSYCMYPLCTLIAGLVVVGFMKDYINNMATLISRPRMLKILESPSSDDFPSLNVQMLFSLLSPDGILKNNTLALLRTYLVALSPQSTQDLIVTMKQCLIQDPYNRLMKHHEKWLPLVTRRLASFKWTDPSGVPNQVVFVQGCLSVLSIMTLPRGEETMAALDYLEGNYLMVYKAIQPPVSRPGVILPLSTSLPTPNQEGDLKIKMLPGRRTGTSINTSLVPLSAMTGGGRNQKNLLPILARHSVPVRIYPMGSYHMHVMASNTNRVACLGQVPRPGEVEEVDDVMEDVQDRAYRSALPLKHGSVQLVSTPSKKDSTLDPIKPATQDFTPMAVSLDDLHQHMLAWDYDAMSSKEDYSTVMQHTGLELTLIPNEFQSVAQYRAVFAPLLLVGLHRENDFILMTFNYETWAYGMEPEDIVYAYPADLPQVHSSQVKDGRPHALGLVTQVDMHRCIVIKFYMEGEARLQPRIKTFSRGVRIGSKFKVAKLTNMIPVHRQYQTLMDIDRYGLLRELLHPRPPRAVRNDPSRVKHLEPFYNKPQLEAIQTAVNNIGFTMIQGPPGTGKTRTIVGLLSAFFKDHPAILNPTAKTTSRNYRILLCAPSNAAIDELITRIRQGIPTSLGGVFKPKVVRIGNQRRVHHMVHDVLLHSL
eukprot:Ihof_evm1s74 gene=Ihof_evmTU1s74